MKKKKELKDEFELDIEFEIDKNNRVDMNQVIELISAYNKLFRTYEKQKDNWNKLKEYLNYKSERAVGEDEYIYDEIYNEMQEIEKGYGTEQWGAEPNKEYYVLKILSVEKIILEVVYELR